MLTFEHARVAGPTGTQRAAGGARGGGAHAAVRLGAAWGSRRAPRSWWGCIHFLQGSLSFIDHMTTGQAQRSVHPMLRAACGDEGWCCICHLCRPNPVAVNGDMQLVDIAERHACAAWWMLTRTHGWASLMQDRRRQRQRQSGAGRCRHSAAPSAATAAALGAAWRTMAEDGAAAATAEVGLALPSPACRPPSAASTLGILHSVYWYVDRWMQPSCAGSWLREMQASAVGIEVVRDRLLCVQRQAHQSAARRGCWRQTRCP